MTTETTRLRELLLEFARDYQDCRDRLGKPEIALDGFETFLTSNPESPFAEAVRQRDEARRTLEPFARLATEYDERVYPDDPDSQLVGVRLGDLRRARAFLSNFPDEAPSVAYTEKERE